MARAIKNIHSKEVEQAICIIGQCHEPSIIKPVKNGLYFYTSYWMDTDIVLRTEGVVRYRKLKRTIKRMREIKKRENRNATV